MARSPGDPEEAEEASAADTRRTAAGRSSTGPNIGTLRGGYGAEVLWPRRSRDLHLDGAGVLEEEVLTALLELLAHLGSAMTRRRRRRRHCWGAPGASRRRGRPGGGGGSSGSPEIPPRSRRRPTPWYLSELAITHPKVSCALPSFIPLGLMHGGVVPIQFIADHRGRRFKSLAGHSSCENSDRHSSCVVFSIMQFAFCEPHGNSLS